MDNALKDLATQAWVYGFPIVFNLDQVRRYVSTGVGANRAAPRLVDAVRAIVVPNYRPE
ncbi:hypothetical protein ACFVJ5_31605 [Nocardia sp. NPDC127606]|uniref:hypothetical protein n=1 Tax=Nocardia sp. NPDC127606 TaxID=3345406 RepID=UPI003629B470